MSIQANADLQFVLWTASLWSCSIRQIKFCTMRYKQVATPFTGHTNAHWSVHSWSHTSIIYFYALWTPCSSTCPEIWWTALLLSVMFTQKFSDSLLGMDLAAGLQNWLLVLQQFLCWMDRVRLGFHGCHARTLCGSSCLHQCFLRDGSPLSLVVK